MVLQDILVISISFLIDIDLISKVGWPISMVLLGFHDLCFDKANRAPQSGLTPWGKVKGVEQLCGGPLARFCLVFNDWSLDKANLRHPKVA